MMRIFGSGEKLGKQARRARKQWLSAVGAGIILAILIPHVSTTENLNYGGLLSTIAKGESQGNYNAYYGHPENTSITFTSMTIGEVLAWQKEYVDNGSPSSAVGKYQIIRPTLESLVTNLQLDKNEPFDETMQDRLAVALLEKRGVKEFAKGEISREQFAHNLSKEWAALPKAMGEKPQESYYAGDGLNKVQVTPNEVFSSIDTLSN